MLRAIDDQVKSIVADGLSVYRVDPELLDRLAPTLIVTQTQCEVCAVSLKDVERAVCQLISSRPKIVSLEPLSLSDIWRDITPELVDIAGGTQLFGDPGRHSGYCTMEELAVADPSVIAVMPCGFDIERARREMPALRARPEWPQLSAVKNSRVFITDGNQYFNRPGPRVVESAEILAELLHPEDVDFGHRGTGWAPDSPW